MLLRVVSVEGVWSVVWVTRLMTVWLRLSLVATPLVHRLFSFPQTEERQQLPEQIRPHGGYDEPRRLVGTGRDGMTPPLLPAPLGPVKRDQQLSDRS